MFKSSWSKRTIFAGVVVGTCALAYSMGLPADTNQGLVTVDGLSVSASALNFGEAWESSHFEWILPIQNRTTSDIDIVGFEASCTCVKIEPKRLLVHAGETASVALTLDLTHRSLDEVGFGERPFSLRVRPVRAAGAGDPHGGWLLEGRIKSRVTLDTLKLDFGDIPVHGQTPAWRKIVVTTFSPAQGLRVTAAPALAATEIQRVPGKTNQFVVMLAPLPSLPPGPFRFDLAVDLVAPDGHTKPGVILPVAGEMQPEVRALPARVLLGGHAVGSTVAATIVLQVPAGAHWVVDHIETESAGLRVQATELDGMPKGRAFTIRQTVRP